MRNVIMCLKALRLYLLNVFLNKIPFNGVRIFFYKFFLKVGDDSNILLNVKILNSNFSRKQIIIGNNCIVNSNCLLDGRVGKIVLGNNVDIGRDTYIYTLEHDPQSDVHEVRHGDVFIDDNVWIASRVTILPGVSIGKGAVIACGAVVTKNVESNTIVAGVPAKVIGKRESKILYKNKYFPFFPS